MDIEIKHAGTSEMPYIYLAELRLCEDHIIMVLMKMNMDVVCVI